MYINIEPSREANFDENSLRLLKAHYLKPTETLAQEALARTAMCYDGGDKALAQRIYDAASKKWIGFASPVISNAVPKTTPEERPTMKALPISCYVQHVPNSIKGLCDHTTEERYASVRGAGIGANWSAVQSTDKKAPGVISFMHTVDSDMVSYKQGSTRRASYGGYLLVNHPEIIQFIKMRIPEGDINRQNLNLHHGVTITDDFMHAVDNNLQMDLVDPEDGRVTNTVSARMIWELILDTRFRTGEPYIFHKDEANRHLPKLQADKGLEVKSSNLCSEIMLATDEERSAVCVLSSLNLATYNEWKDTDLVADMITFLDNVLEVFIDNVEPALHKAKFSAIRERSLGLGTMGWADYLQKQRIPFESALALGAAHRVFGDIKNKAEAQTLVLGLERGQPEDIVGSGRRNAHLLAGAPTSNNAIITGVSPASEPRQANWFIQKTRIGSLFIRNPILEDLLETMGMNTDDIWELIKHDKGSVQNLDFLGPDDKELFKTAKEYDQRHLVDNARVRQLYIDQGQSFNVFLEFGSDRELVNQVHRRAFSQNGVGAPLKSMYYLKSGSASDVKNSGKKVERVALEDGDKYDDCISCGG